MGKTHLAVALAEAAIQAGQAAYFMTAHDLRLSGAKGRATTRVIMEEAAVGGESTCPVRFSEDLPNWDCVLRSETSRRDYGTGVGGDSLEGTCMSALPSVRCNDPERVL